MERRNGGAPQGWRRYTEETHLWPLGTNFDMPQCLAAGLVALLRGSARRAAMPIPHADLMRVLGG